MSTPKDPLAGLWDGWLIVARTDIQTLQTELLTQKQQRSSDPYQVAQALVQHAPKLHSGTANISSDSIPWDRLLDALQHGASVFQFHRRVSLLIRGIERGNRDGRWQLEPPGPVRLFRRDLSLFTQENMALKARLDPLTELFVSSLEKTTSLATEARVGQLIFSAIFHGALLKTSAVTEMVNQLPRDVFSDSRQVWIDLPATAWATSSKYAQDGADAKLLRRWIPDPLTQLLLITGVHDGTWEAFAATGKRLRPASIWRLLKVFLAEVNPNSSRPPLAEFVSLPQFIRACSVRMAIHLSPFLLDYARGRSESFSLPPAPWIRIREGARVVPGDPPALASKPVLTLPIRRQETSQARSGDSQVSLYLDLIRAIDGQSASRNKAHRIKRIRRLLNLKGHDFYPLLWALAQWAIRGLRHRQEGGRGWQASTVVRYVTAIGRHFAARIPNQLPKEMAEEQFLELYESILKESGRSMQASAYAVGRILDFHHYLVTEWLAPEIDSSEWAELVGVTSVTAVNLVTETEYQIARVTLSKFAEPHHLGACRLAMTLGYRCGLRRSECHGLRLLDIYPDGIEPYVQIQKTPHNKLKSPASRRRIPLSPFLSHSELQELRQWKWAQSTSKAASPHSCLFPSIEDPTRPMAQSELFDPIHAALRTATGDAKISFHTLRHSFANHTLLMLLEVDPVGDLHLASFREEHRPVALKEQIDEQIFGKNQSKRAALYALAMLMGHSDPQTSLRHYVHHMDLLLARELTLVTTSLSVRTVQGWRGLSGARCAALASASSGSGVAPARLLQAYLYRKARRQPYPQHRGFRRSPRRVQLLPVPSPAPLTLTILWASIERTLARCSAAGFTLDNPPPDICPFALACTRAAMEIAGLPTKLGRARHKTLPVYPHLHQDRYDTVHYWHRLNSLGRIAAQRAQWACELFIHGTTQRKAEVQFEHRSDLMRYLKFLSDLQIPAGKILLRHHPNRHSRWSAGEQLAEWQQKLARKLTGPEIVSTQRFTKRGRHGTVGVIVLSADQSSNAGMAKASYGFRYAIHSWAVLQLANEIC